MQLQLENKVVLIGGGTRGIGLACAESFLQEGARVAVFSRDPMHIEQAVIRLSEKYGADLVMASQADYTDSASIEALIANVQKKWGAIFVFVASSGGPVPSEAANVTQDAIQQALNANLLGISNVVHLLLPAMRAAKFGRFIFITTSGVVQPIAGLATSNIARAALTAFAKTLASEVGKDGITVNTVIPGKIETARLAAITKKNADREAVSLEQQQQDDWKAIPVGRYGRPEEMADMVTFLASPRASYITGSNIAVDGGLIRALR